MLSQGGAAGWAGSRTLASPSPPVGVYIMAEFAQRRPWWAAQQCHCSHCPGGCCTRLSAAHAVLSSAPPTLVGHAVHLGQMRLRGHAGVAEMVHGEGDGDMADEHGRLLEARRTTPARDLVRRHCRRCDFFAQRHRSRRWIPRRSLPKRVVGRGRSGGRAIGVCSSSLSSSSSSSSSLSELLRERVASSLLPLGR